MNEPMNRLVAAIKNTQHLDLFNLITSEGFAYNYKQAFEENNNNYPQAYLESMAQLFEKLNSENVVEFSNALFTIKVLENISRLNPLGPKYTEDFRESLMWVFDEGDANGDHALIQNRILGLLVDHNRVDQSFERLENYIDHEINEDSREDFHNMLNQIENLVNEVQDYEEHEGEEIGGGGEAGAGSEMDMDDDSSQDGSSSPRSDVNYPKGGDLLPQGRHHSQ